MFIHFITFRNKQFFACIYNVRCFPNYCSKRCLHWIIQSVIFITLLCIDYWKIWRKNKLYIFIIEQLLHLAVIILLCLFLTNQFVVTYGGIANLLHNDKLWILLSGYLLVLKPSSIRLFFLPNDYELIVYQNNCFQNIEQWIESLEQVLILTFMLIGKIEAKK